MATNLFGKFVEISYTKYMKLCCVCKVEKDEISFHKRKNGKCYSYCIDCHRNYVKSHYNNNKTYYLDKAKRNGEIADEKYNKYKESLSCTDCGISFEGKGYLCDFHHMDNNKEFNPATLKDSWKRFMNEVEKCIPLCANCHRTRHHGQVV